LFSAKQFDRVSGEIHIKLRICTLTNKKEELITTCQLDTNLYMKLGDSIGLNLITNIHALTHNSKAYLWHLRLGHINQRRLSEIQDMPKGIDNFNVSEVNSCIPRLRGKQHKIKFSKRGYIKQTNFRVGSHGHLWSFTNTNSFRIYLFHYVHRPDKIYSSFSNEQ
jgi:hypothetical protein